MHTITIPDVDMLMVARSARANRRSMLGFAPEIGLAGIDYGRMGLIDNFYLESQDLRDYYHDNYNKLPRPASFRPYYEKCTSKVDENTAILLRPNNWVRLPEPQLFPIEYDKTLRKDVGFPMDPRYNTLSCTRFKR